MLALFDLYIPVHTFLKDSDHVLKEFDKTEAEDKCLLLIRKPKSASKQVLCKTNEKFNKMNSIQIFTEESVVGSIGKVKSFRRDCWTVSLSKTHLLSTEMVLLRKVFAPAQHVGKL